VFECGGIEELLGRISSMTQAVQPFEGQEVSGLFVTKESVCPQIVLTAGYLLDGGVVPGRKTNI
jgi:hypothetical protein